MFNHQKYIKVLSEISKHGTGGIQCTPDAPIKETFYEQCLAVVLTRGGDS